MHDSKIEWVLNPDNKTLGKIWNPITGCLNCTPEGLCRGGIFPCYAYKLANGRLKPLYLANPNISPVQTESPGYYTSKLVDSLDPFYPRFWEDRLYGPCLIKKPVGIFTVDMGELFGDWIPIEWQDLIFSVIEAMPQHRFYLLTKQPQNLPAWSPFPDNCWVGVTATDSFDFINRIGLLGMVEAKVKYMSFEPLLDWEPFLTPLFQRYIKLLDWVIIGAQTNPYKPPKIEWVEEIVRACDKAGIPVFLKDNLGSLLPIDRPFYKPIPLSGWDDNFAWEYRQEILE